MSKTQKMKAIHAGPHIALKKSSTASLCTFICFALSIGIPPQGVMKWTGHKDHKAMKPYIDIAEKVKAKQMAIFEKNLKG